MRISNEDGFALQTEGERPSPLRNACGACDPTPMSFLLSMPPEVAFLLKHENEEKNDAVVLPGTSSEGNDPLLGSQKLPLVREDQAELKSANKSPDFGRFESTVSQDETVENRISSPYNKTSITSHFTKEREYSAQPFSESSFRSPVYLQDADFLRFLYTGDAAATSESISHTTALTVREETHTRMVGMVAVERSSTDADIAGSTYSLGTTRKVEHGDGMIMRWGKHMETQLARRVSWQMQSGISQAQLRIDPVSMGIIHIVVRQSAGGLSVEMLASNTEVARQLQAIGEAMRQEISNKQQTDVTLAVRHDRGFGAGEGHSSGKKTPRQHAPGRALDESRGVTSHHEFGLGSTGT